MKLEEYNKLLQKAEGLETKEEFEDLDSEICNFLENVIKQDKNDYEAELNLGLHLLVHKVTIEIGDRFEIAEKMNLAFKHVKRAYEIIGKLNAIDNALDYFCDLLTNDIVTCINSNVNLLNQRYVECGSNIAATEYVSATTYCDKIEDDCMSHLYFFGDEIEKNYGREKISNAISLWKCANKIAKDNEYKKQELYVYSKKIHKYDDSYKIINVEDRYKPLDERIEMAKDIAKKGGELPESFFFGESALTSYEIPKGITKIKRSAFENCKNLEKIVIPEGVVEIEENAFCKCESLKSVTIPTSVEKIGASAFYHCCETIYEKKGIEEIIFAKNSNLKIIEMFAFSHCELLKKIEFPSSLKEIGEYAFNFCSQLDSISFPLSLKKIGKDAFTFTNIKSVVMPRFCSCYKRSFPETCERKDQNIISWVVCKIKSFFEKRD